MFKPAYTFDDITLIPRYSDIKSRFSDEIKMESSLFAALELKYPLISANMSTVTESKLAFAMEKLGGLGIVHRFMSPEQQVNEIKDLKRKILCLGVDQESKERLEYCLKSFVPTGILIDIAHAHCKAMKDMIYYVKSVINIPIIAGNIATYDGTKFLADCGVQSIKVGVSSGSVCSTRVKTGNGVPQVTALLESVRAIDEGCYNVSIISDGGIRNSGDIVKCLALGASAVMGGGIFAGCNETPGEIIGLSYPVKKYAGMASKISQLSWKGYVSSVEGEERDVPVKGPVENIFNDLVAGIRSGFSYQGARNIQELQRNAEFYFQTRAGFVEGTPYHH